jgi:protein TonB
MRPTASVRVSRAPSRLLALAMLAAITAACSAGSDEAPAATDNLATVPRADIAPTPSAADVAAEAMETKAQQAVADNRLYAPAGNNAIEFYLAQRERAAQGGANADAALIELQPYAMMAAEQAIASDDLTEAERLVTLMVRIDAAAPSVVRLREDIAARRQALEAADAAQQAVAEAEIAARAVAVPESPAEPTRALVATTPPRTSPPRPSSPSPTAAPNRATAAPAASASAPAVARPDTVARVTPPREAAPAPGPLVPVSTPFPPFPSEAIARGRSMGSVTVRFTVRPNGRVADVRVVEARPEGLFERTVTETLADWRFEPTGLEQAQTRTFNFRN